MMGSPDVTTTCGRSASLAGMLTIMSQMLFQHNRCMRMPQERVVLEEAQLTTKLLPPCMQLEYQTMKQVVLQQVSQTPEENRHGEVGHLSNHLSLCSSTRNLFCCGCQLREGCGAGTIHCMAQYNHGVGPLPLLKMHKWLISYILNSTKNKSLLDLIDALTAFYRASYTQLLGQE